MTGTKTIIYKDENTKVIRCDVDRKFFYTRTYIYENGKLIKDITVFADGSVSIGEAEPEED